MFQAVVSTYHLKIKFPTKGGIGEVRCDQREARRCYNLSIKCSDPDKAGKRKVGEQGGEIEKIKKMKPERIEPIEGHKEIELFLGRVGTTTRTWSQMSPDLETLTIDFLRTNSDMFTWSPSDFQGIDPEIIVHRLNVDPQSKPVK
ncbi:UNVERIFIED_CONTAM: hypothetical protein Slati_4472300 [Sesamum latifolium]|uniref:Uncharacterized protein n=1 Tax=Sesamum latifolium TaxID=2727402 RepID=A0AAW2SR72_9LAMI